jgi:hypothetical protein
VPEWHHITIATLRRCSSSGNVGAGGTEATPNQPLKSRGASAIRSLNMRSTSAVISIGHMVGPAVTVLTGCRRKVNAVTTPKLPPPPRRAQKQLAVLVGARAHDRAVGEDDLGLEQVVDREPVLAGEVAVAAAERQPPTPVWR